jgi:hypothetical protein
MTNPDVYDLLAATDPYVENTDKLMLYGQFVGSWHIDAIWYDPGGGQKTAKGEWHFGWILGGQGIQDVLFRVGAPGYQ